MIKSQSLLPFQLHAGIPCRALLWYIVAGYLSAAFALTTAEQDSAFTAYNQAFWDVRRNVLTLDNRNSTVEKFWTASNEWVMIMDAYERSNNPAYLTQIHDFYTGFCAYWATKTSPVGTRDWWTIATDSDGHAGVGNFNDDMVWAALACARAYLITRVDGYRDQAKRVFDFVWTRAHDDIIGGGLYWNTNNDYKNSCINFPAVITAVYLYKTFQDSTYFTKATDLYAWCRNNLINRTTGAVYDGKRPNESIGYTTYTYNQGTMIGAAHELYQLTNNRTYYNDAITAMDYAMEELCVAGTDVLKNENNDYNQPGFKGIFALYASKFAQESDVSWHLTWLQHMATTVYYHRGSAGNLTYNNFAEFGLDTLRNAWEAYGGCNLIQVLPADNTCVPLSINKPVDANGYIGTYEPARAIDRSVAPGSAWRCDVSGDKWLSIDLGELCTINRWEIQHAGAGGENASYNTRNFKLQGSLDQSRWFDIATVTGNTANQTISDVTPTEARYARIYITQAGQTGNQTAHIYEFTVFGILPTSTHENMTTLALHDKWCIRQHSTFTGIHYPRTASEKTVPVQFLIYTLSGQLLRRLSCDLSNGDSPVIIFDNRNKAGIKLPSGNYLCQMRTSHRNETKKFLLLH